MDIAWAAPPSFRQGKVKLWMATLIYMFASLSAKGSHCPDAYSSLVRRGHITQEMLERLDQASADDRVIIVPRRTADQAAAITPPPHQQAYQAPQQPPYPIGRTSLTREQAVAQYPERIEQVAILGDPQTHYYSLPGARWREYSPSHLFNTIPLQGWKLHVSPQPQQALAVAQLLLPELRRRGIVHKVANNLNWYAGLRGNDPNFGKYITIYPRSESEAVGLSNFIYETLRDAGFLGSDFMQTRGDLLVRHGVSARYGRLRPGNLLDPYGREIPGSEDQVIIQGRGLITDDRNLPVPDGIRNPFY